MKNRFSSRRLAAISSAVLLAVIVVAFAAVPAFAEADGMASSDATQSLIAGQADSRTEVQYIEPFYAEDVNPLYADELAGVDLIDEETILAQLEKAEKPSDAGTLSLRSSDEKKGAAKDDEGEDPDVSVFTKQEDAIAYIREALLDHADTIVFKLETDSSYADYAFPMFYAALAEPEAEDSDEYKALIDYLRYNYAGIGCSCTGTYVEGDYTITYTYLVSYNSSKEQSEQVFAHAQQIVESFGFGDDTSEYQKVKAIYDYICKHVVYDYAHLDNEGYLLKYSAYAALENGTAVCQGYSQLFDFMCGYAGVPARSISGVGVSSTGNVEAHAWNIVGFEQDEGNVLYYDVDSTWDSSNYQDGQPYTYFLKSESDFVNHSRGYWENVVDYTDDAFCKAHPMSNISYELPTEVIGTIEYSFVGNEATAVAYVPGDQMLSKLEVPETVEGADGKTYTVTTIGVGFLGESDSSDAVVTVVLPPTITEIQSQAFLRSGISQINLPDGLLRIGEHAFWNCNCLTEVSLPASLELVGYRAFGACYGLQTVKVLGPTTIGKGAFMDLKASTLADGSMAKESTVFVCTPCQHRMIADGGDTYITQDRTTLILAEPESSDPGHKPLRIEEAPATCESPGFAEHWECLACGKKFVDEECVVELDAPIVYEPLGHNWIEDRIKKQATSTESGIRVYACSRCGEEREEDIPPLTWELVSTEDPTCEKDGCRLYTNANGETMEEIIPKLGHDWDAWETDVEATCTEFGSEHRICTRDSSHVERRAISALGHDCIPVVTDPTCTENGYTTHKCTRCRYSYTDSITTALGHNWGEWVVDNEPDCTESGSRHHTCLRCNDVQDEAIEPLGHGYTAAVTEPTCTEDGYTTYTCSRCGDSYVDDRVAALGHDWGEWVVDNEPDCTESGSRHHTCLRCNDVQDETIEPLGHGYASIITAPTCTVAGYTTHTCSRCGDSYVDAKTAALGHSWDSGKVTTAPTYTAQGVKTFTCTRCGATRTEAIATLPKLNQTIAPAKKTYVVKFSKVKLKAQKIAVKFVASGGGAITYKAAKTAGGKVKIAKNGKVTVAKGTKKGFYTLKVKVTAAATTSHNALTTTVKLKVRVK